VTTGPTSLLEVRGLRTVFGSGARELAAVDGIDFSLARGGTLGLVGESGCGKSLTALSILRLVPSPPGRIAAGEIRFDGTDLMRLREPELRKIRGNRISMVFQEPMTSLNPVFTVGNQIGEAIRLHQGVRGHALTERVIELLGRVRMPDPKQRIHDYPGQMSGGMRQRVMIAMALACRPDLLIADEPTTALDVTVQAQILDLLAELRQELGMAMLLISHDLGVVAEVTDAVAVMYSGKIVETAPTAELFENPRHPYTRGLIRSLPRQQMPTAATGARLASIPGTVPDIAARPSGCAFRDRCPIAQPECALAPPPLVAVGGDLAHLVACPFHELETSAAP
jgi:peptide/nickel transport system ATP-binding protein